MKRSCFAVLPSVLAVALAQTPPTAEQLASRLTANALKSHVSFLASDAFEGRATPSPGLEIAAEYIAAQFRRAGLEPGGDDHYFQTATFTSVMPSSEPARVTLSIGGRAIEIPPGSMRLNDAVAADLSDAAIVRVAAAGVADLNEAQTRGKALLIDGLGFRADFATLHPSLVILLMPEGLNAGTGPVRPMLRDASLPPPTAPLLLVWDQAVRDALNAAPGAEIRVSAHVPPPAASAMKLKNVVGILRGSDTALRETCLVVSAHYDHLGVGSQAKGDRIFNGANDNASGTASLIELANVLAASPTRPKRSIVFVALFGEEAGLFGSRYYVRHARFPASKTIAAINLEQLGRTDDLQGKKVGQFNLTGFDFTTLASVFRQAADDAGVKAVKDEKNSDPFFSRSDNAPFANAGIPSTTVSVTYMFPDYHALADEWPKLDYENMSKVDTALALACFRLADSPEAPQWNAANPAAARYVKAREADR